MRQILIPVDDAPNIIYQICDKLYTGEQLVEMVNQTTMNGNPFGDQNNMNEILKSIMDVIQGTKQQPNNIDDPKPNEDNSTEDDNNIQIKRKQTSIMPIGLTLEAVCDNKISTSKLFVKNIQQELNDNISFKIGESHFIMPYTQEDNKYYIDQLVTIDNNPKFMKIELCEDVSDNTNQFIINME